MSRGLFLALVLPTVVVVMVAALDCPHAITPVAGFDQFINAGFEQLDEGWAFYPQSAVWAFGSGAIDGVLSVILGNNNRPSSISQSVVVPSTAQFLRFKLALHGTLPSSNILGFSVVIDGVIAFELSLRQAKALQYFNDIIMVPIGMWADDFQHAFNVSALGISDVLFVVDSFSLTRADCNDGVFSWPEEECEIDGYNCNCDCTCKAGFVPDAIGGCVAASTFCGDGILEDFEECETDVAGCNETFCICGDGLTSSPEIIGTCEQTLPQRFSTSSMSTVSSTTTSTSSKMTSIQESSSNSENHRREPTESEFAESAISPAIVPASLPWWIWVIVGCAAIVLLSTIIAGVLYRRHQQKKKLPRW